jgi:hemolysin activation/secretion protein
VCLMLANYPFSRNAAAQTAPPGEAQGFDIWEYQVEGNSLLPAAVIERAVYPHLGENLGIEAVEAAREALEKTYRGAGFSTVVVSVPEQAVDGGIVRLRVTEATVSKVRVVGSKYYSQGRIIESVPSVAPGRTPRFPDFQSDLQVVNRFPGSRVTPILRPGKTPGTTEIDLSVEDKFPLSGSVELNNYRSPNTTRTRLTAIANYENLWQALHNLSIQYQTAPEKPDETKVWVASYLMPVSGSDKLIVGYVVRSRSAVAALADFNVIGNGDIVGLRLVDPLPAAGKLYHSLTLGLDYKTFKENVEQVGTPGIQTPIRYLPASVSWSGTRASNNGEWQFSTGLTLGLRGAGSDQLEFENKRFKAYGNFFVWKWDVQRTQTLSKSLSLTARLDGQLADQPLVSNEQFSAGGQNTVRGYLESEKIGDNGMHASLELRGASMMAEAGATKLQPLVFAEGAYLWLQDPLPGQDSRFSVYSAGLGLRLSEWRSLDASLDVGWPLRNSTYSSKGAPEVQFSITMKF